MIPLRTWLKMWLTALSKRFCNSLESSPLTASAFTLRKIAGRTEGPAAAAGTLVQTKLVEIFETSKRAYQSKIRNTAQRAFELTFGG